MKGRRTLLKELHTWDVVLKGSCVMTAALFLLPIALIHQGVALMLATALENHIAEYEELLEEAERRDRDKS